MTGIIEEFHVAERSDADSNYESAEDESEYLSITGSQEEIQFQQFNLGNIASRECGDQNEDDNDSSRDSSVQIISVSYSRRRSLRIMNNRREKKGMLLNGDVSERLLKYNSGFQTRERRYKCSLCSKSFPKRWNLNLHTRTHTGEKPFHCLTCSKSFSQMPNLKTHSRVHIGVKPYKCSICSKSFSSNRSLNSHTRTHTGEKPSDCAPLQPV